MRHKIWMCMTMVAAVSAVVPVGAVGAPSGSGGSCELSAATMSGWQSTTTASSSRRPNSGFEMPLGHAVSVKLHPFQQVHFATDTGNKHVAKGSAGNLTLTVRKDGTYRFVLDSDVTVEVASNGRMADSVGQGDVSGCGDVQRYVEFQLVRGSYALQLSGSSKRTVKVLATLEQ